MCFHSIFPAKSACEMVVNKIRHNLLKALFRVGICNTSTKYTNISSEELSKPAEQQVKQNIHIKLVTHKLNIKSKSSYQYINMHDPSLDVTLFNNARQCKISNQLSM